MWYGTFQRASAHKQRLYCVQSVAIKAMLVPLPPPEGVYICQCPMLWHSGIACVGHVKREQTLLVNSKTPQKAILHPILEGQRDRVYCVEQCTPMLLEIQRPRLNQQSQLWRGLHNGAGGHRGCGALSRPPRAARRPPGVCGGCGSHPGRCPSGGHQWTLAGGGREFCWFFGGTRA
jgi:hypothetical protein